MVASVGPQDLELWLEWAAAKLIAMPAGRLKPAAYRSYWPDFVRDVYDNLHASSRNKIWALAPSSSEITIVDQIIFLPNLCKDRRTRQTLHWRAQVHPITGEYLLSWFWIAKKLDTKPRAIKALHKNGLEEVLLAAPAENIDHIATYFLDCSSAQFLITS